MYGHGKKSDSAECTQKIRIPPNQNPRLYVPTSTGSGCY